MLCEFNCWLWPFKDLDVTSAFHEPQNVREAFPIAYLVSHDEFVSEDADEELSLLPESLEGHTLSCSC